MPIEEVSAERFAQLFHHYHQTLGQEAGNAQLCTGDAWESVPPSEKHRLIAATRLALHEVEVVGREDESRRYFAKPGEAEWGC